MRPIEKVDNSFTFAYEGDMFRYEKGDGYYRVDGEKKVKLDKKTSNDLMEALLAGHIIEENK